MTPRRLAGAVVAGALCWGVGIGLAVAACDGPEPVPSQQELARTLDDRGDRDDVGEMQDDGAGEYIEEDDPRWDCTTMGNRECGAQAA